MNHIDLFSGIGGFALAAHWAGYKTEVFCEQDQYCQKVLKKHWPTVPVISDIRDFDGTQYREADLLTGGFPCQPFSYAGKQRGHEDDRFLWPELYRVISEARPNWCLLENVPGIINLALDGVLADLEAEGYETQAFIIPACAVNAPHRRDRIWIVANARCEFGNQRRTKPESNKSVSDFYYKRCDKNVAYSTSERIRTESSSSRERTSTLCCGESVADTEQQRSQRITRRRMPDAWRTSIKSSDSSWQRPSIAGLGGVAARLPGRMDGHFDSEPNIPRVATGVKNRVSRLKALGNAIVPQVAYEILRMIRLGEEGNKSD